MNGSGEALIFGQGVEGIVAVEPYPAAQSVTIYRRVGATVETTTAPLRAWVLSRRPLEGSVELSGRHPLRHLLQIADGRAAASAAQALAADQRLSYQDWATAHLVATGHTLFRGLRFPDLRRLQFDIETLDVYPERDDASVCLIALCDTSGFERVLSLDDFPNEGALLAEFANIVRQRDPDVIEGHNVFNFDLWFLAERAKRWNLPLVLGRDGRTPLWLDESIRRSAYGGLTVKYYRIEGRQIVDTFFGAMRWDVARRLPNYKLKHIVKTLGIGDPGRALVDASNMRALWADPSERAKLRAYCLDDARDTGRLSNLVMPNEFYQVQMVPETLQGLAFVGIGSRIERLMVRAYLRAGASIPRPHPVQPIEGAFAAALETGVFSDVVKCDVESLYPSLMLARRIGPQDDDLDVFLPMLAALRTMRVRAKNEAAEANAAGRSLDFLAADGLQSAFKILINSFFGFLGTNGLHFNDPQAAMRITQAGREVMERIVTQLRGEGCTVIEADTDGAFFTAPFALDAADIVARVGAGLGEGLHLVCEERYEAMLSLKAKNYAVKRRNGEFLLRGSALRSARDEPFGRGLLRDIAAALVEHREGDIAPLVRQTAERIRGGQMAPEEFSRRESVTSKTFTAPSSKRLAQALTERGVAIGDKVRIYQRVGGELALSEEYAADEDREFLLRRLADFVARFGELVPPDARIAAGADPSQLSLL